MAVKIRLQRHGRKKRPYYHIVIADARAPRDGKFIERIGMYNPLTVPATIELDNDRALHWLGCGAQPTNTCRAILSFSGVMYRKHLQRGVKKGAFTQEEADLKFSQWIAAKSDKIKNRVESLASDISSKAAAKAEAEREKRMANRPKEEVVEAAEEVADAGEAVAEEVAETAAEAVEEVTETVEEATEAVVEEATEAVEAVAEEATEVVAEATEEAAPEAPAEEEKTEEA